MSGLGNSDDYCNGLDVGAVVQSHQWELGLLGTGTKKCTKCGQTRPREVAETDAEEKRLQYAEEGFRNAAHEIADALETMAKELDDASRSAELQASALRVSATRATLIGKGRSG